MESDRTFYDIDYKKTCASVGWALFLFLGIYNLLGALSSIASGAIEENVEILYKWRYTFVELIHIAVYIISFLVPAFFLRRMLKRKELFRAPAYTLGRTTKNSLLLIPATVAVAIMASYINTLVMAYFGLTEAYESLVGFDGMYEGYQILLLYISTALVPAFVEEFLFRGTILANLAPYGKRGAILISSLLFGLMHQNPYQIIYTTAAGVILGMAYVKTGSIWLPTAMHFVNNAYSVTNQVIYANLEYTIATGILLVGRILVLAIGAAALVLYLISENKKAARKFDGGFFGRDVEPDHAYAEKPISDGVAVKGFLRVSVILYIVAAVLLMLALFISLVIIASSGVGTV